jgi:Uma2 family endonuclease
MGTGNDMRPVTAPPGKLTYGDLLNFPNDGTRHEIIDGDLCVTPSPNTRHQRVSIALTLALGSYLKRHAIGEVFAAPFDVVFSDLDVVEPDLLYISRERAGILTDQHVSGSPDLVVEILSIGTRKTDEVTKRHLYERFDVKEYWVLDPELDMVKVYRRSGGGFTRAADLTAGAGDTLTTPLLPDFSVSLTDLFARP